MESLLRWSIENSSPQDGSSSDAVPLERKGLDPGIIDHILGKSDAVQMKDDMSVALDVSKSESERVEALDHLELLTEHIDNANNLHKLGLWEPLQALVTAEKSTPDIQVHALWVIGTAVQHNPAAQDEYLNLNPFPVLVSLLDASWCPSNAVRAKVLYVLSGLLRHNAHAVKDFSDPEVNGWPKLRDSLQDPDISIRRKVVFIMGTLLASNRVSNLRRPSRNDVADNSASPAPNFSDGQIPPGSVAPTEPIHPNSHAANLKDPYRIATSELTLDAIREHHIAECVVDSIVNPLPHGDYHGADPDYDEKAMRLVHTYVVICSQELLNPQKNALSEYLRDSQTKYDMPYLLDRLGLSSQEFKSLVERVSQ